MCWQVLAKVPRSTKVLLIAFAAAVSVFHLADWQGVVAADVFPGHGVAGPGALKVLTDSARRGGCIAPLHSCREAAEAAIQSLRCASGARD